MRFLGQLTLVVTSTLKGGFRCRLGGVAFGSNDPTLSLRLSARLGGREP